MIQIIHADVIDGLRQLPDQSVHCVVTSPPYWGLRDYGTARWEGGDPDCDHVDPIKYNERLRQKKSMIAVGERLDGSTRTRVHDEQIGTQWQYRDICKKCGAVRVDPQIGLEKTPEEYVTRMVEVFREVRRVLRDDGTLWLNLGDTYAASRSYQVPDTKHPACDEHHKGSHEVPEGLKQKDMIGIPWRVAFALQADGWYLRSDIIWSKPNPMPESVTDRPTKSHEYIFLLTKKARYFYDADAVREASIRPDLIGKSRLSGVIGLEGQRNDCGRQHDYCDPAGRNRRTVWEIATQSFPGSHFATFPEALVEPCIKAGTSERGCCSVCGAPWVRVVEKGDPLEDQNRACGADSEGGYNGISHKNLQRSDPHSFHIARVQQQNASDVKRRILDGMRERISEWFPSCICYNTEIKCPDTIPCTVLDPFGGSGTVAKVARDLNRKAILIELNAEYIKIARERLRLNEQLKVFV